MKKTLLILICICFIVCSWGTPAKPEPSLVKQDTDKDGRIDRIAHLDKDGEILRLEIDSDGDGFMDRFQYYDQGKIIRLEADRNHDGKTDSRDYFEDGKRTRHEEYSLETGRINPIIYFDKDEKIEVKASVITDKDCAACLRDCPVGR